MEYERIWPSASVVTSVVCKCSVPVDHHVFRHPAWDLGHCPSISRSRSNAARRHLGFGWACGLEIFGPEVAASTRSWTMLVLWHWMISIFWASFYTGVLERHFCAVWGCGVTSRSPRDSWIEVISPGDRRDRAGMPSPSFQTWKMKGPHHNTPHQPFESLCQFQVHGCGEADRLHDVSIRLHLNLKVSSSSWDGHRYVALAFLEPPLPQKTT